MGGEDTGEAEPWHLAADEPWGERETAELMPRLLGQRLRRCRCRERCHPAGREGWVGGAEPRRVTAGTALGFRSSEKCLDTPWTQRREGHSFRGRWWAKGSAGRSSPPWVSEVRGRERGPLSSEVSGTSSGPNGGAGPVPSQQPAGAGDTRPRALVLALSTQSSVGLCLSLPLSRLGGRLGPSPVFFAVAYPQGPGLSRELQSTRVLSLFCYTVKSYQEIRASDCAFFWAGPFRRPVLMVRKSG